MSDSWSELMEGFSDEQPPQQWSAEQEWGDSTQYADEPEQQYDAQDTGYPDNNPDNSSGYQDPEPAYEEPAEDSFDASMSEAETRLHKAALYKQFTSGRIFDGSNDQLTLQVEEEFRAFARHQLSQLLGIGTDSVFGNQFSTIETTILKKLAQRAIEQAGLNKSEKRMITRPQPAPVKPVVAQQARPQPQPVRPQPPRPQPRPQLRPRQSPESVRPQLQVRQSPSQQSLKPRQAPPQPRPPQRPQQSRPQQRPQQPRPPQRPQQQQQQRPPQNQPGTNPQRPPVLKDGEVLTEKGRTLKVKWTGMAPDEYGQQGEAIMRRIPPGGSKILPNGIQVVRTAGDEFYKIVKMDITKAAVDNRAVPMPSIDQMAAISAMHAAVAVQKLPTSAHTVAGHLAE